MDTTTPRPRRGRVRTILAAVALCAPVFAMRAEAAGGVNALAAGPGQTVTLARSTVVDGGGEPVVVAGTVRLAPGASLTIRSLSEIRISGTIAAAKAATGADGGTINLAAPRVVVARGALVQAGDGGDGAAASGPTAFGGAGGDGGDVVLIAASGQVDGMLVAGHGGKGGDATGQSTAVGGPGGDGGRVQAASAAPGCPGDDGGDGLDDTQTGVAGDSPGEPGLGAPANGGPADSGGAGFGTNTAGNPGCNGGNGGTGGSAVTTGGSGADGCPPGNGASVTATGGAGGAGGAGGQGGASTGGAGGHGGNGGNGGDGGAAFASGGKGGKTTCGGVDGIPGNAVAKGGDGGPGGAGGEPGGGAPPGEPGHDGDGGQGGAATAAGDGKNDAKDGQDMPGGADAGGNESEAEGSSQGSESDGPPDGCRRGQTTRLTLQLNGVWLAGSGVSSAGMAGTGNTQQFEVSWEDCGFVGETRRGVVQSTDYNLIGFGVAGSNVCGSLHGTIEDGELVQAGAVAILSFRTVYTFCSSITSNPVNVVGVYYVVPTAVDRSSAAWSGAFAGVD